MNTMPAIIIFICTLANAVAMYYSGKSSGYREGYESGYRYGRLMGFAQATLNQNYERMIDEIANAHREQLDQLKAENARLKQELEAVGTAAYLYGRTDIANENAKLREQTELLVTLLRNDCDIEASWDGLRRFWSIGLTENGCLMRDRACKAEAENAKLRELCAGLLTGYECGHGELCKGCTWDGLGDPETFPCLPRVKARELGIEVDE